MIIEDNFRTLRSRAIDKLTGDEKKYSFGYHIDVNNWWERIYHTQELLSYLSIHNTHSAKYSELCFDIQDFLIHTRDQIQFHSKIINKTSQYISTLDDLPDYKYDLLELSIDWLALNGINNNISTLIDFGAGCGRQVIGAVINTKFKCYIGIDASTNGYLVQNALFSTLQILDEVNHIDLLDYESNNSIIPNLPIINLEKNVVHYPAWIDYKNINDNSIDLLLLCHVHNEISGNDFNRVLNIIKSKLHEKSYIYVRSELGIWADTLYEDSVYFHAMDPVIYFNELGFIPLLSKYVGGFQTTIFCHKTQYEKNIELNKLFEINFVILLENIKTLNILFD